MTVAKNKRILSIGLAMIKSKEYQKAINFFTDIILNDYDFKKDLYFQSSIYYYTGICFKKNNQTDQAIESFRKTLEISKKRGDEHNLVSSSALNEIGTILFEQEDYEEAKKLYEKSLEIREYIKSKPKYLEQSLHNIIAVCDKLKINTSKYYSKLAEIYSGNQLLNSHLLPYNKIAGHPLSKISEDEVLKSEDQTAKKDETNSNVEVITIDDKINNFKQYLEVSESGTLNKILPLDLKRNPRDNKENLPYESENVDNEIKLKSPIAYYSPRLEEKTEIIQDKGKRVRKKIDFFENTAAGKSVNFNENEPEISEELSEKEQKQQQVETNRKQLYPLKLSDHKASYKNIFENNPNYGNSGVTPRIASSSTSRSIYDKEQITSYDGQGYKTRTTTLEHYKVRSGIFFQTGQGSLIQDSAYVFDYSQVAQSPNSNPNPSRLLDIKKINCCKGSCNIL